MRTSRRMRTRQPCSATVRLSGVLSDNPGNFFALYTAKGIDLTSKRKCTCARGAIGLLLRSLSFDFGLPPGGSTSASLSSLSSSNRLKLSRYKPSWRTDKSGKMKYPAGLGRSRYAIPATGEPVKTGWVGGATGNLPLAIGRAFSNVVKRKKLALWEKVMSVLSSRSPSNILSSTTGGGSTGRRSAEASARSVVAGWRQRVHGTYILPQIHMLWLFPAVELL